QGGRRRSRGGQEEDQVTAVRTAGLGFDPEGVTENSRGFQPPVGGNENTLAPKGYPRLEVRVALRGHDHFCHGFQGSRSLRSPTPGDYRRPLGVQAQTPPPADRSPSPPTRRVSALCSTIREPPGPPVGGPVSFPTSTGTVVANAPTAGARVRLRLVPSAG